MKHKVSLTVNGKAVEVSLSANRTLAEMLREDLRLTGVKQGCGEGECGACTVLLDGKPVSSCLVLALECDGCKVDTIEGLARGNELHPLQQAFVKHGAIQCGFCTPGMLMTAKALLDNEPRPSAERVREALSGNLCRCTGYQKIVDAVVDCARGEKVRDGGNK